MDPDVAGRLAARRSTASPARRSCGIARCPCRSCGHRPATSVSNDVHVVGEPGAGDVVDERVVPTSILPASASHVPSSRSALSPFSAIGNGMPQVTRRPLPRDREVLEASADEAEHLVAPEVGLHEVGVVGVSGARVAPGTPTGGGPVFSVSHWSGISGWFGQIVPRAVSRTSVAFRKPSLGRYQPSYVPR